MRISTLAYLLPMRKKHSNTRFNAATGRETVKPATFNCAIDMEGSIGEADNEIFQQYQRIAGLEAVFYSFTGRTPSAPAKAKY